MGCWDISLKLTSTKTFSSTQWENQSDLLLPLHLVFPAAIKTCFEGASRGERGVTAAAEQERREGGGGGGVGARRLPPLTSAAPQRGHKPVRTGPSHSSHVTWWQALTRMEHMSVLRKKCENQGWKIPFSPQWVTLGSCRETRMMNQVRDQNWRNLSKEGSWSDIDRRAVIEDRCVKIGDFLEGWQWEYSVLPVVAGWIHPLV